jgi:hypothetical protein
MATLVVGSVTVKVAYQDQAEKVDVVGGEIVRMFDGTARSTVRGFKRTWTIVTRLLNSTDAGALKTALETTTLPVSCSGDITGSVNCIPRLTDNTAVRAAASMRRRMTFTLTEV